MYYVNMTRIFHRGWIQIVFTRLQHLGWLGLACPSMKQCLLHIYHNLDMYIFRRPKQSGPELEREGTAVIQLQMQFELWQRKRQSNLVHLQFRLSQIIITFQSIKKVVTFVTSRLTHRYNIHCILFAFDPSSSNDRRISVMLVSVLRRRGRAALLLMDGRGARKFNCLQFGW